MANSYIQRTGISSAGSTVGISDPFPANVTAASRLIVVVFSSDTSASVSTVTDSLGNSYTQAGSTVTLAGVGSLSLWYKANTGAGSCTITVTMAAAVDFGFDAYEYAGVAATASVEGTANATGTSATPATGNITVSSGDAMVFAAFLTQSGFVGGPVTAPFTARGYGSTTVGRLQSADHLAATVTEGCTFNQLASAGWIATGVSFSTAAPPTPAPTPGPRWLDPNPMGPAIPGSPWFPQTFDNAGTYFTPDPDAPPAPRPGPPVPPDSPGSLLLAPVRDESNEGKRRLYRFTEIVSIFFNSCVQNGQIVQVGPDEFEIVAEGSGGGSGLTGIYGTSGSYEG